MMILCSKKSNNMCDFFIKDFLYILTMNFTLEVLDLYISHNLQAFSVFAECDSQVETIIKQYLILSYILP